MTKQNFLDILIHYQNIPEGDISELQELEKEYPYAQIVRGLVAKASHDAGLPDTKIKLHKAAIHISDRAVLKNLIENKIAKPVEDYSLEELAQATPKHSPNPGISHSVEIAGRKSVPAKTETTVMTSLGPVTPMGQDESDRLREEVMRNLALVRESRKPYRAMFFNEDEHGNAIPVAESIKEKKVKTEKNRGKKKHKENFIERVTKEIVHTPAPQQKKIKKEQSHIIDQFIAKEPSIERRIISADINTGSQEDLSEQSSEFGEGLVSETLANIFIKQGKKDKAKEIYKKLIWKFPQKKAYFATLIDDLNKI